MGVVLTECWLRKMSRMLTSLSIKITGGPLVGFGTCWEHVHPLNSRVESVRRFDSYCYEALLTGLYILLDHAH